MVARISVAAFCLFTCSFTANAVVPAGPVFSAEKQRIIDGFTAVSATSDGQHAQNAKVAEKCQGSAVEAIGKAMAATGVSGLLGAEIDETKILGKNADGILIAEYKSKMIIADDGFYPGAHAEVITLLNSECSIRAINVDMNYVTHRVEN